MIPAGYFERADAPSKGSPVGVMMQRLSWRFPGMDVEKLRLKAKEALRGVGAQVLPHSIPCAENPLTGKGWSPHEEEVITQIMSAEGCLRMEAIRRMRRRRLDDLRGAVPVGAVSMEETPKRGGRPRSQLSAGARASRIRRQKREHMRRVRRRAQ
jgi:hypothetical protein